MIRLEEETEEVFVEVIDFGKNVSANEIVTPNADGSYTIFINSRIATNQQADSVKHALRHIHNNDFQKQDVQQIEASAHRVETYQTHQEKTKDEIELEEMIRRHRRAAARHAKKLAEYQKFIELRMLVDEEYRKEHMIF